MKRCALCGGPLGLISHRQGMLRFCKLAHKTAYIELKREQLKAEQRRKSGSIFLAAAPLSFLIFGALAPVLVATLAAIRRASSFVSTWRPIAVRAITVGPGNNREGCMPSRPSVRLPQERPPKPGATKPLHP